MGTLHKSPIHPSKHSSWPSGVHVKCPAWLSSFDSHAYLAAISQRTFHFCEPDIIIKRSLNLDPNTWRCHDVLEIGVGLRNLAPSVLKLNSIMPSTSAIHIKRSDRFDSMKTWVFRKAINRTSNLGFFPTHKVSTIYWKTAALVSISDDMFTTQTTNNDNSPAYEMTQRVTG